MISTTEKSNDSMGEAGKRRVYIVDGSGYVFRAYYARGHRNLSTSTGEPTFAVYTFVRMLFKLIKEHKPKFLAVAFDKGRDTFRKEIYTQYKANRPEPPPDLITQAERIKEIVSALGIPVLERDGFEADDIIGSLAKRLKQEGFSVVIVTGDKDFIQLIDDDIVLIDTMKDETTTYDDVVEKLGIPPERFVDVLALEGDKSDNIPGVPGIGRKTALKIVSAFGDLEDIIKNTNALPISERLKKSLAENAELARLSKRLATIRTDIDLGVSIDEITFDGVNTEKALQIFKELEFFSLIDELSNSELNPSTDGPDAGNERSKQVASVDYRTVRSEEELTEVIAKCKESKLFAFDLETTSLSTVDADIVGISFSWKEGQAAYVPLAHTGMMEVQMDRTKALSMIAPMLESSEYIKVAHNLKYDMEVLHGAGLKVEAPFGDSMLLSYLLNPGKRMHGLDALAVSLFGHKMISYKQITKRGKQQIGFDEVDVESASKYSCEDADFCLRVYNRLVDRVKELNLWNVYETIELPLVPVLASIEEHGVKIDEHILREIGKELSANLKELEGKIYKIAGTEFNINSPQQLGFVLFEKLKLPHGRKTKGGAWSTDMDVLGKLAKEHPLPELVLRYRGLMKLKSTYVESLLRLINKRTKRVHTSYNQAVTLTGRLSSSEPNLQNIPVRTAIGKRIREAFVADEGCLIVSADYSQIELRLLAQMSGDETMLKAFESGQDVHSITASEVFGVPLDEVDDELRRRAKTINFGIVYGMSPFGLSQELNISMADAKAFIDAYFERYSKVKQFMDANIQFAKAHKCVYTLWGRRIPIPDIDSKNAQSRQLAERVAINAPIQGSAADLIKLAMIRIGQRLTEEEMASKLIMQVHDELVFEVPKDELDALMDIAKDEMVSAGGEKVRVPLVVDTGFGKNWAEAH